ncbi:MAG: DNA repair protein RadC [Candidatus Omnitrophica bacterium]|nr:DNA repair protein RadC [Candidatus Omnitrophota bacterium]
MEEKSRQNKIYKEAIRNWPEDERPREKLLKFGEHTLSNTELLAILLRTGIKGESAIDLARRILQKFKTFRNMSHTDLSCWKEFKGLGKAKLCQIKAALEIGRRFQEQEAREKRIKITSSKDVVNLLLARMRDLKKEVFKVLLLDGKNKLIDIVEVEEGSITEAHPIIREIIFKALQNFSASIICIHNHPSGEPEPSQEDKDFTKQIKDASEIMQIKLLDHIIIGDNKYFSFADEGLI